MRTLEALLAMFLPPTWIPLVNIQANAKNPRTALELSKTFIDSFAAGFRITEGPIHAYEVAPGKFVILSGHRRYAAMQELRTQDKLKNEHAQMYVSLFKGELSPEEESLLIAWGNAQTNAGKRRLSHTENVIMTLGLPKTMQATASEREIARAIGLTDSQRFESITCQKLARIALATSCTDEVIHNLRARTWVVANPSADRVKYLRELADSTEAPESRKAKLFTYLGDVQTVTAEPKALGKTKLEEAAKSCPSQYIADVYRSVAKGIAPEVSPAMARLIDALNRCSPKELEATEEYLRDLAPHAFPKPEEPEKKPEETEKKEGGKANKVKATAAKTKTK